MPLLLTGLIFFLLFINFLSNAIPVEDVSKRMYSSLLNAAKRQQSFASPERMPASESKNIATRMRELEHTRQQIATLEENMNKISQKNRDYFENVLTRYRNDELVLRQGIKDEDIRSFQEHQKHAQQRRQDINEILASNKQRSRDQQEQFYRNLELHQARMANQLQRLNDLRERSPMTIQRN